MLSVFPQLLDYAYLGPMVLRFGVGLILIHLAYQIGFTHRSTTIKLIEDFHFKPSLLWLSLSTVSTFLIACLVVIGLYTQVVALLIILIGLKLIILKAVKNTDFGLSNSAYFLLIIIGLYLLISGPGQFGFDLPL